MEWEFRKRKVYVAGPMRGIPLFNFPEFDRAELELIAAGYEVFNPASIDREAGFDPEDLPSDWDWSVLPPTLLREDIVKRDLAALQQCDVILMLDGWENSTGAQAELAVAKWLGLAVIYETDPPTERPGAKDTNPKDSIGTRKAGLGNVPGGVLLELGLAMKEGAHKYGAHNYRIAGVSARVYYEAAMRHLIQWWEGEDIDTESGAPLPHTVKAMACLVVLRDAERQLKLTDDRPVKSLPFMDQLNDWASQLVDRFPNPVQPYLQKDY